MLEPSRTGTDLKVVLILPASGLFCGVRWFETDVSGLLSIPSSRVITQTTEELRSTAPEAYDLAKVESSHSIP
jgi:hypothetical protein